jgi:peptidoglycan lytic transglycosylase G
MINKRTIWALLVLSSVLFSSFIFYAYQIIYSPNFQVAKEKTYIMVPVGGSFDAVRDSLYKYDIVQDVVSFSFLAKLMNYTVAVKPGIYEIAPNMTNIEAIRLLRSGNQTATYVTFNYGRLIEDIAEPISRNIAFSPSEFLQEVEVYSKSNSDGFTEETLIGMFIPNTYQVYYTVTPENLLKKLNKEYHKFWNAERTAKAEALGLTLKEVSTLASIVQAESVKPDESSIIAGLYYNRLKRGIPLQADPTLVFASGDFTLKRVLNEHKEIDSPYNTYKYRGLPPGPINMPSIQSIDAVLNYKKHNYIYMCAKEDFSGYHNFTSNLRQHNVNANKYQRALTDEIRKGRIIEGQSLQQNK